MELLPVLVRRHWVDAKDDIRFPEGKAANVLRGGFGHSLREIASPELYERIFEPKAKGPGPRPANSTTLTPTSGPLAILFSIYPSRFWPDDPHVELRSSVYKRIDRSGNFRYLKERCSTGAIRVALPGDASHLVFMRHS